MSNQEQLSHLQGVVKHTQALYSDGMLYFAGEEVLATTERKNITRADIKLIRASLDFLEKQLV